MLAQVREQARASRQFGDDALQTLFAARMLIGSIEADRPDLPPKVGLQLRRTDQTLDQAIRQLYAYSLNHPSPK